ncbi:MAG: hypothetical protein LDL47_00485 [Cyanobacteria bacterium KgW148]|nr:hypothetical protein [Cyanobacteria bacterium KgW148]
MSPFPDNLSYIKAELSWLDRVVTKAIARQKQINQEINKVAKTATDRATSHWWRGFVTLDPAQGGREVPPEQTANCLKLSDRVQKTKEAGIFLALPELCAHFKLSEFEKNTILLALAPEITRRYERLFMILNEDDTNSRLPTIDLALRLFSKNDKEWQKNRQSLLPNGKLLKKRMIKIIKREQIIPTFLGQCYKIEEKYVHFLLNENTSLAPILPRPRKKKITAV